VAQPPGGYGSHDATAQRCRGRKASRLLIGASRLSWVVRAL